MHGTLKQGYPSPEPGLQAEVRITDLNQHGQGIGRIDGMVLFVDGAVPGDLACVLVDRIRTSYAVATLVSLKEQSASRVLPPCPVFARCGGCSLQALSYSAQLDWKRDRICEQLRRIGGLADADEKTDPVRGMSVPWQYRSKVQFPVRGNSNAPEIGFFARRSHRVADAELCLIQHPVADLVRSVMRDHIRAYQIEPYQEETHSGLLRHIVVRVGFYTGQVMVVPVINGHHLPGSEALGIRLKQAIGDWRHQPQSETIQTAFTERFRLTSFMLNVNQRRGNIVLGNQNTLLDGNPWIEERILETVYRISPQAFFQVNPEQTEVLYRLVLEMAELRGEERVLDLYCGTGSISLLLAGRAKAVIGVEIVDQAIRDARQNAIRNGLDNVVFVTAAAEIWLPDYITKGGKVDRIVLDPPRKGCDPALLQSVLESGAPSLVYVSCNPATLARDLSVLARRYQLIRVAPVDMFPHSDSVECVALLKRRPNPV